MLVVVEVGGDIILLTVGCWGGAAGDGLWNSSRLSLRILALYMSFVGEG